MIKLFKFNDKEFNSNGDKIITALKAQVYKEDNGEFYLELETSLRYINDLKLLAILVVDLPQGAQAFRISKIQKTKMKISVKAYHVYYDGKNYLIKDNYIFRRTCDFALKYLNDNTDTKSPFNVSSDITKIESFRCVRNSLWEAIQTIVEKWGGHIVRDNFNIRIQSQIGRDNGIEIRYAKNLKELTCETSWDNVVTKLLPVGKNGILLNGLNEDEDVYITSNVKYELPFTKAINFGQDIDEKDFRIDKKDENSKVDTLRYKSALITDLRQKAEKYIKENEKPKVNYTLKAHLDNISDIGDVITVIDERLGINISTTVTAFKYDCILGKYNEIVFGNIKNTASTLIDYVVSKCSSLITKQEHSMQEWINSSRTGVNNQLTALNKSVNRLESKIQDSVLTAFLGADVNLLQKNKHTPLILRTTRNVLNISELSLSANGIKIMYNQLAIIDRLERYYWVKVSAIVAYEAKTVSGNRTISIIKNVEEHRKVTLVTTTNYMVPGQPCTVAIPPTLVRVRKDDVISLCYRTSQEDDVIHGNVEGNLTYLTVEVVK
jgi:phage minor structural protein